MKVVYYGSGDVSNIENFAGVITNSNNYTFILDNQVGEDNVVYNSIKKFNISKEDVLFINFDTMKPAYNFDIGNIINNVQIFQGGKKNFIVFLNRYLDSANQVNYLKELGSPSFVSMFESFNPGNSDAFYIDSGIVDLIIHGNLKTRRNIIDLVRDGKARGYSFNPNLITYNFKDSTESAKVEFSKSSPISDDERFDLRKLSRNISIFFSDHVILFWVFMVFFICLSFLFFLRVFKIGSKYF